MKEITLFIIVTIGVIGLILFGVNALTRKSCLESYSSYTAEYGFWTGCRIMVDGKLTPTDIVRELK